MQLFVPCVVKIVKYDENTFSPNGHFLLFGELIAAVSKRRVTVGLGDAYKFRCIYYREPMPILAEDRIDPIMTVFSENPYDGTSLISNSAYDILEFFSEPYSSFPQPNQ